MGRMQEAKEFFCRRGNGWDMEKRQGKDTAGEEMRRYCGRQGEGTVGELKVSIPCVSNGRIPLQITSIDIMDPFLSILQIPTISLHVYITNQELLMLSEICCDWLVQYIPKFITRSVSFHFEYKCNFCL